MLDGKKLGLARQSAMDVAIANIPNEGQILKEKDITFGVWDTKLRTFTENASSPNAVQVVTRRAKANGNALSLIFGAVIGHKYTDVGETAIATFKGGGPEFKFLLDDEFIDNDVPTIEALAAKLKQKPDDLISDKNGDGFIDLPPGTVIELPTGQVGDEGLFDRTTYGGAFPFQSGSTYSTTDFLAEGTALEKKLGTKKLQNVEWTNGQAPHKDFKKLLDPVPGIDPMDSHAEMLKLPNPDTQYLSPLFKSDVSMQEKDPSKYGSTTANCQGDRRGLLAFKILAARNNPAGGSYLPLITIEVLDPQLIDLTSKSAGKRRTTLVQ